MIKTCKHRGIQLFFNTGKTTGIKAKHAKRPRLQLGNLNRAQRPSDMNVPGWRLHPLKGTASGHWPKLQADYDLW